MPRSYLRAFEPHPHPALRPHRSRSGQVATIWPDSVTGILRWTHDRTENRCQPQGGRGGMLAGRMGNPNNAVVPFLLHAKGVDSLAQEQQDDAAEEIEDDESSDGTEP